MKQLCDKLLKKSQKGKKYNAAQIESSIKGLLKTYKESITGVEVGPLEKDGKFGRAFIK